MSFASLHSGLLVRKGEAAPSAPGAVDFPQAPPPPADEAAAWLVQRRDVPPAPPPSPRPKVQDRLGRGLLEFAQSPAGRPRRPEPPVLRIVDADSEPVPPPPAKTKPARAPAPSRVMLLLKPEQERRLNLAAARLGKPRARLVAQALDALLDGLADGPLKHCSCYRGQGAVGEGCCGG